MGSNDGIHEVNGYDVFEQETVTPAVPEPEPEPDGEDEDEDGADG
ncbi:hypothetical protein [Streptomyces alboflavus]